MRTRGLRGASFVRSFPFTLFMTEFTCPDAWPQIQGGAMSQSPTLLVRRLRRLKIFVGGLETAAPWVCYVRAMLFLRCVIFAAIAASSVRGNELIARPPAGKLYQGLYCDEPAAGRDPPAHDVTPADVARFEETLGTKTAWV